MSEAVSDSLDGTISELDSHGYGKISLARPFANGATTVFFKLAQVKTSAGANVHVGSLSSFIGAPVVAHVRAVDGGSALLADGEVLLK
jgi:hypothetical protein